PRIFVAPAATIVRFGAVAARMSRRSGSVGRAGVGPRPNDPPAAADDGASPLRRAGVASLPAAIVVAAPVVATAHFGRGRAVRLRRYAFDRSPAAAASAARHDGERADRVARNDQRLP